MLLSFERPTRETHVSASSAVLENCTVATSILDLRQKINVEKASFTVKIVRAHGGCLGT
jgi:hypothetical protein